MKAFQSRWQPLSASTLAYAASVAAVVLLTACGGGGSSNRSTGNTSQSVGGATATQAVGPVTLMGVAAMGAPLLGATVSVVDANGVLQGTTTTNASDGSYSLLLSASNIPLPLLIEANGVDMAGTPTSLHTVVQAATSGATRITAHINSATDAVVAMLLGADPAAQFSSASSLASSWTQLGNATALASASDLLKTIAKTNISDAKVTNASRLDFFQDATFAANKSGLDAVLEGLSIQIGQDSGGRSQLEISNRFRQPGAPEVTISLSSALTQLNLGTTGKIADAITSTAKVTTSVASLINNVGSLDALSTGINQAIAEQLSATMIAVKPFFSAGFVVHDGANVFDVATALAGYGAAGWQLSRLQFTGCADDPMPATGCNKPIVSALVSDSTGQVVDVFSNVVNYSASTGWTLKGNGRQSKWSITGAAWSSWSGSGLLTGNGQGVRVSVVPLIDSMLTTLLLPSVHSISLFDCHATYWCLNSSTNGDLVSDYVLQSSQLGWFGREDSTKGARYQMSATSVLVPNGEVTSAVLPNNVPVGTPSSIYPLPDGLSASTPLTCADVSAGRHVTWSAWAAANPTMRMVAVRTTMTAASQVAPWVQNAIVYPLAGNATNVPAASSPPASPTSCQLWMVAKDRQGRQFISKIDASS